MSSCSRKTSPTRKQATDELRKLNSELEERVRERTTQLEQLAREMEEQSLTDPLTGLPNRRALDHKLGLEVRLSLRHKVPLSLLLLDVDSFKQYNDSFGHPAGDEVLRALGRLLQVHTRATDFAARWGGEEFAVMLRHTEEDGARIVASASARRSRLRRDAPGSYGVRRVGNFGGPRPTTWRCSPRRIRHYTRPSGAVATASLARGICRRSRARKTRKSA